MRKIQVRKTNRCIKYGIINLILMFVRLINAFRSKLLEKYKKSASDIRLVSKNRKNLNSITVTIFYYQPCGII